jgi:hypothetical protein
VGCVDVAMVPDNPEIIYAALYGRRRTPWSFVYGTSVTNGEDVGGIFKSTNGGGSWKKCSNGLPTSTGRIGLAVTPTNPRIVMAVIQSDEGGSSDFTDIHSKRGGVFRSEDGGENWKRTSDLDPRPFYFSQIRIDPANDQRVYLLGLRSLLLTMAGKHFAKIYQTSCIRTCTHSPFKIEARRHRNRQKRNPARRRNHQSRRSRCVCLLGTMAAFSKVTLAAKAGSI